MRISKCQLCNCLHLLAGSRKVRDCGAVVFEYVGASTSQVSFQLLTFECDESPIDFRLPERLLDGEVNHEPVLLGGLLNLRIESNRFRLEISFQPFDLDVEIDRAFLKRFKFPMIEEVIKIWCNFARAVP